MENLGKFSRCENDLKIEPLLTNKDTIAAIATPLGSGGLGIIRISGDKAPQIITRLFRRYHSDGLWQSHHLYVGQVVTEKGIVLDEAMAVLMYAPYSYTREQVAELHCHGGAAHLSQVLAACLAAGARLAERGEFTLRAFLNGALSLDEAEAVADLISARTTTAAQLAARQLIGSLSSRISELEQNLLSVLAKIAVGVDFPDDVETPTAEDIAGCLCVLKEEIAKLLAKADLGRVFRDGLRLVLAGATNVGKSSLFNCLLQTERAIVTAEAGTTRDIIEESIQLDGMPLILTDTAGLRANQTLLEAENKGIERSHTALAAAQLVLVVADITHGLDDEGKSLLTKFAATSEVGFPNHSNKTAANRQTCLLLLNKSDLLNPQEITASLTTIKESYPCLTTVVVSAKTGAGIDDLLKHIKEQSFSGCFEQGKEPLLNNIRHQQALVRADEYLAAALQTLAEGHTPDLAAIDVENAYQAVGEISGKTVSEEVLSSIFANFCVGK